MLMKTKKALSNSQELGYYMPPKIQNMLNKAKDQVIRKDWDRVYLIDGSEGSGKSLFGLQLGKFLDPTLSLDNVVFNGDDFSKAISEAKKNQCIIFDEAFNGLGSSAATSKLNRLIVRKLMECRQKNLFIIVILPTVFLLQKYVAIFRSQCLFHVYATNKGVRGYYRVYNKLNKKLLYIQGYKLYSYSKPYVKNSYRFYGVYPLDEGQYRKKKLESLEYDEDARREDRYAIRFAILAKSLKEDHGIAYTDQIRLLEQHNWGLKKQQMSLLMSKIPQINSQS